MKNKLIIKATCCFSQKLLTHFFYSWLIAFTFIIPVNAQIPVDFSHFNKNGQAKAELKGSLLTVTWSAGKAEHGKIIINTENEKPLFTSIQLSKNGVFKEIGSQLDPAFILTTGKRDLVSQNGWNIFFDSTNRGPHKEFIAAIHKRNASVSTAGSRTIIKISDVKAGAFNGAIEITLYNGSPLFNVAAVMATKIDSTAIFMMGAC